VERREFTKLMAVGGTALAMGGMGGQGALAAGNGKHAKISRNQRKEWARDTWKGFENIVMASFSGPNLGQLDEAGIRHDIRQSIAHGFFSSLLEASSLTDAELKRFVGIAADEAGDKLHLALTTGPRPEAEILAMLDYAETVGVQTFLLSPPGQGSAEDLINYCQRIARSTNLAAYLYLSSYHKFNRFHPSGVPVPVLDVLVKEPNIVGAKIGTPDPGFYVEIFERYGKEFLPNSGWIPLFPLLVPKYGLQWSGGWTVEALQTPDQPYAVEFFKQLQAGRTAEAMKLYWAHVRPGFDTMMKRMGPRSAGGAHPWEFLKYYQFLAGGNGGRYRVDPSHPEVKGVTDADMQELRADYKTIGLKPTALSDAAFANGRVQYKA